MSSPPQSPPQNPTSMFSPPQKPAAKTQFSDILEDIILCEILPRLPVKSLFRFKSVSTKWRSVISDPQFAKTHFTHLSSLSSRSVLTLDYSSNFEALDYGDFNLDYEDFNLVFSRFGRNTRIIASDNLDFSKPNNSPFNSLVDSCKGLALLVPDYCFNSDFRFVVYNPVLGHHAFIEIQHPQGLHVPNEQLTYENLSFGFGYVSSHKDYYIVAIKFPQCLTRPESVAFVYSLKTREWKTKETPRKDQENRLVLQDYWVNRIGVLLKETLHWGIAIGQDKCILVFDLATQEGFTKMELPHANFGEGVNFAFSLCCLNDCLCAWGIYEDGDVVEMCMMKEYGVQESWTKLFHQRLDDYYCRDFFGFTKSEWVLVFKSRDELMLADFSRDPPETLLVPNFDDKVSVVEYVQSLVSPLAVTGREEDG
ncbi:F-box/kelch-repeat protein At3g23880-like [Chenopodium quinoa]|uniref:F-box/kelch-repeat protein At3g23880-like n=1 Tax=Chenopodium quinoa TaxID=63459 RepID=UPI000B77F0B1|nr:F-box/kelch-repeat protein At3g23880-like [Chenopodium quinoa]